MRISSKLANTKYDFVKTSKYYILGAILVIVAGIIALCVHGVNLGIDFTGGTVVNIKAGEKLNDKATYDSYVERADSVLNEFGLKIAYNQKEGSGEETTLQIRYQDIEGKDVDEMYEITKDVVIALQEEFDAEGEVVEAGDRITATASSRLVLNAILAVAIASVLIMIYLAVRFKQFKFGICSIIGLVHDVLIVCAFMLIFNLEVSSVFIASLITVIGYSINNNVVIFDRMRENASRYPNLSAHDLTNKSLAQSLTRTFITTITTLIVIAVVAIVGVPSIGAFCLQILVGISAGLYSSLTIVTPLWAIMSKNDKLNFKGKTKKVESVKDNEEIIVEA